MINSEFVVERAWQSNYTTPLRWVASHVRRHGWWIVGLVIGAFSNAALAAAVPVLTGRAFEAVKASDTGLLGWAALWIIIGQLVRAVLQLLRNFSAEVIGQRLERDVRDELYTSLLGKSMAFHDRQSTGDIMARATNDVREMNLMLNPGINLVVGSGMFLIMPLVVAPAYHWQLLAAPLVFLIAYGWLVRDYLRQLDPTTALVRKSFGQLNSTLAEAIDGIETVKGAAQEDREQSRFIAGVRRWRDAFVRQGDVEAVFLPVLLLGLTQGFGFLHSVLLFRAGLITVENLIAFNGLLLLFGFPTFTAQFAYSQVSSGLASARRILELINTETELDENVQGYAKTMRGEIIFEDVSFSYAGKANVLDQISFRIEPGQTVALVGQTGSGKSALTKLINRTYDVTTGRILVDGVDVRDWNLAALRQQISMIEQDIFLFSRTIGENISFGVPEATPDQIEEAARAAQAHDFIMRLADGYDTVIGERGVTLSGGQRQRLALARAFLTTPHVMILDDSTSAIDSATEDRIQRAIEQASRNRTTILITHRLSQIRWADLIIVLRKGRVAAIGSHDQLLQDSEAYRAIFARYQLQEWGMFAGLDTEAYDRQYDDRTLLRRMMAYFGAHRRAVILTSTAVTGLALINAIQPLLLGLAINSMSANPSWTLIIGLALIFLVTGGLAWAANLWRQRLTARVIGDVISALRNDAFQAAISHDLSFFDEFKSGKIISRITSDTQEFSQVAKIITDVMSQFLTVIVLLVYLFSQSWQLTLGILVFMPLVIVLAIGFRIAARFVTRKGFQVLAGVNSAIQEAVTGISVAKNFRQEQHIYDEFRAINNQSYAVNLRRGFVLSNVFPTLNILLGFGTAGLIYWGGLAVIDATISLAVWYVFVRSVDLFWFPLINLSSFWSQFQAGLSAAERIFALIDAESTVRQQDSQQLTAIRGEICFDQVRFAYGHQEQVLADFSLHIKPGESIALVGHTGAGKSSIAKLIARFYEFQSGTITIDGVDLRALDLHSYRKQLGIVSQVPFLFDGTVASNIRYAAPELTDEQIEAVARQIGAGEWLETLTNGIHSTVGERGAKLSLGQRQLVALTRVLAAQPAIFILDEATASIDPFTETQIQQAMDLILARSTSILIAHRLSTVRSVDRIIVLDQGRIIESGNHEALMAQGGHYAELYDTYFRHQSLSYIEERGSQIRK